MPASLTVQERASAHAIAENVGLKHDSFGDGEKRYLRVVPPKQQPPPKQLLELRNQLLDDEALESCVLGHGMEDGHVAPYHRPFRSEVPSHRLTPCERGKQNATSTINAIAFSRDGFEVLQEYYFYIITPCKEQLNETD